MKKNQLFTKIFLIMTLSAFGQAKRQLNDNNINSLFGEWHCVKFGVKGYQKFSLVQGEKLKFSIFELEKNRCFYHDISFIDTCWFNRIELSPYDTSDLSIEALNDYL